jgi:hypothetical protein
LRAISRTDLDAPVRSIAYRRVIATRVHRAAVIVALAGNGLVVLPILPVWPEPLPLAVPLAAVPAVLFVLLRRPAAFASWHWCLASSTPRYRDRAGCAAASPALDADPNARRRRYLGYVGATVATFLILGAILAVYGI